MNVLTHTEARLAKSDSLLTALRIYSAYRLLQISALLSIFMLDSTNAVPGKENPAVFLVIACIYLVFCIISFAQTLFKQLPQIHDTGVLFVFFIDVLAISSFIHFSGGLQATLAIMMVATVAAAGIFLPRRLALFIAAFASLTILGEQIYLYVSGDLKGDQFGTSGILGLALFGAALTVQQLSERLRTSEQLLSEQTEQVQTLEKINEQIIELMPNGVIVVDEWLRLKFMNTAAWRLLQNPSFPDNTGIEEISPNLARQVKAWKDNPDSTTETFRSGNSGISLHASFAPLGQTEHPAGTVIFIDDASLLSAQAQKMKLASLGTLTAGIAHEIRNPLGAISHAAQLLQESTSLAEADKRLTDIIQQHSIRMNRIIENVLQLSRQKTGKFERVHLGEWVKTFIREFKAAKPYDIIFAYAISKNVSHIEIDVSQLGQVLTNLCENGLRYSFAYSAEHYIRLECGFDDAHQRHYIDIIDKGTGVDPKTVDKIFEPFFTTDSKGSGLGLYIAKELCENNRCTLSYLQNTSQSGGCFRISFSS